MINQILRQRLLASSGLMAAALAITAPAMIALTAVPGEALAQTATPPAADAKTSKTDAPTEVVVTGSIIRHRNADSNSPLTVITANELDLRGVTTIQNAIQNLAANGSGALPNSFSSNGAFAAGASGASLRGLTTNSTLVLVDGLRAAYYPLADDGTRNFVDLNTIPDVIVDRVEVLKDGASSTYGADAIAGVINVITKKQFQGITVKAEGGDSQKGGASTVNASGLIGHGDLARDGYNFYIGTEYEHDSVLYSRDRGFPYNTNNFSSLCAPSLNGANTSGVNAAGITCRTNGIVNGIQFNNTFAGVGTDIVPVVRPYNAANTTALGNYQLLNPAAGCRGLTPVTVTTAQATNPVTGAVLAGFSAPVTLCQQDFRHDYSVISPDDKRFSLSGRFSKTLGGNAQAYVAVNYYQNEVYYSGSPAAIRNTTTPAATGITTTTTSLALPIYVCASGVNCNATNGTLNPNNPFAALGEVARIFYSFGDIPFNTREVSHTYRFATGLTGTFGKDWNYSADLTGMQTDLQLTANGRLYVPNLLSAVATGAYNFVNPALNTAAVRSFISPTSIQNSSSQLLQAQANLSKALLDLWGGPLELGVGVASRYESVYDPSANDDSNGAVNRYFSINPFGTIGSRTVNSAYFEIDAPIVKQLDVNLSGRYDDYSSGQSNFSPKIGGKFKPIEMITLRSTFSKGFRIPSFAESNALPTTGFVTVSAPTSFNTLHGGDNYGNGYSLGLTTVSSSNLRPEKSDNFTVGFVFDPIRQLSFSADFYRIKKTDVIAPQSYTAAVAAYYAGTPIPAGFTIIPDVADANFPNALPRIAFIKYGLANLNAQTTSGYDFSATARVPLGWVKLTSAFDGNYVLRFNQTFPDGTTQHYAGTLGPYETTSASGTPKFRANWQNTLDFGRETVSATIYYTSGYKETAEDNNAIGATCLTAAGTGTPATYRDNTTPVVCNVKSFIDVDLHGTFQATKNLQLYVDVSNLMNARAPYDPTTYGASNYNPAWANDGIIGRYFKVGAKATF